MDKKPDFVFNEYDRSPSRELIEKNRRRRKLRKRRLTLLGIIILIVLGYMISPLSKVMSIKVTGNSQLTKDLVIKESGITDHTYHFLLNNDTIKDNLKKTGLVTKAYVTHNILGGVSIEIQEAALVAYMELDNKTYVVTEEGKLIQVVEGMNYTGLKQIPKIAGFTDIKAVEELASQYVTIPVTIRNAVSDIVYSPEKGYDDRVALILDDGKKLIVDIQGMKDTLSPSRFDYSAYMQSKSDVCVFSFEGRNLYMTKCE